MTKTALDTRLKRSKRDKSRRAQAAQRGNAKKQDSVLTRQQLALQAIIEHFGGPTNIATHLSEELDGNFSRQIFVNWRARGAVPIMSTFPIAKVLEIDPRLLNYKAQDTMEVFGEEKATWKQLLEAHKEIFPPSYRKRILALSE